MARRRLRGFGYLRQLALHIDVEQHACRDI